MIHFLNIYLNCFGTTNVIPKKNKENKIQIKAKVLKNA